MANVWKLLAVKIAEVAAPLMNCMTRGTEMCFEYFVRHHCAKIGVVSQASHTVVFIRLTPYPTVLAALRNTKG